MSYEPPADREETRDVPPPPAEDLGYGTPTRPVGGTASASAATGGGGLFESYKRAVLSPSVAVFEDEIPRADWGKTLLGVGAVLVTTIIVALITFYGLSALLPDLYNPTKQLADAERQLREAGIFEQWRWVLELGGFFLGVGGVLVSAALTPIMFFIGAGALYVSARLFGGKGGSFSTHAYLLSLSYTPLRVVSNLAALVPIVGGIASLALFFYQLYLAGLSMQASQRMEPGKAMMAAFVPLIVTLLLFCVGIIAVVFIFAANFRR